MNFKNLLGFIAFGLLSCQFTFSQQKAEDTPKETIVINTRMIEMYNNMVTSENKTNSINFFIENYTFNEVVTLFNYHSENEFMAMNKEAIDAFIAEKKNMQDNYIEEQGKVADKRKI